MSAPFPASLAPVVSSVGEAIARMEAIDAGLPATDGLACFNRMYLNLLARWTMNSARDLAWTNSLLLWQVKDDQAGYELLGDSLAASTALASRLLLVAV